MRANEIEDYVGAIAVMLLLLRRRATHFEYCEAKREIRSLVQSDPALKIMFYKMFKEHHIEL